MDPDYSLMQDEPIKLHILRVERHIGEIHVWVYQNSCGFLTDIINEKTPFIGLEISDFSVTRNRKPLPIHYCISDNNQEGLYKLGVPKGIHHTNI